MDIYPDWLLGTSGGSEPSTTIASGGGYVEPTIKYRDKPKPTVRTKDFRLTSEQKEKRYYKIKVETQW